MTQVLMRSWNETINGIQLVQLGVHQALFGLKLLVDGISHRKKDGNLDPAQEESQTVLARRRELRNASSSADVPQKKKLPQKLELHQYVLLNGALALCSVAAMSYGVAPISTWIWESIFGAVEESVIISVLSSLWQMVFGIFWCVPLWAMSKFLNIFWFQDIANAQLKQCRISSVQFPTISKHLADVGYSLLLQAMILFQAWVVSYMPGAGLYLHQFHMTILYSYYCFEYRMVYQGWEVQRRVREIEQNWPYYMGFGLPMTIIIYGSNSLLITTCLCTLCFSILVVSACWAPPIRSEWKFRLPIFSVVIPVLNFAFRMFAVVLKKFKTAAVAKPQQLS